MNAFLAVAIGAIVWQHRRLWREYRRLDRFVVTAQLRNLDEFNRIESRLPHLAGSVQR